MPHSMSLEDSTSFTNVIQRLNSMGFAFGTDASVATQGFNVGFARAPDLCNGTVATDQHIDPKFIATRSRLDLPSR